MDIVPNEMVDGREMLTRIGEQMEKEEAEVEAARAQEDTGDGLMLEIERLVKERGWTADDRRGYLDKLHEGPELPLFADSSDEVDPRLVEALSALKYDGEEPEDLAEQAKVDGNKNFKTASSRKRKMYYREAVKHYTEGCLHCLKALEKTDLTAEKIQEIHELFSALLSNRAACNLVLKNYGSVKRDCSDAIRFVPKNIKAFFRKGKACLELRQYEDGLLVVKEALSMDETNVELLSLQKKLNDGLTERMRREELVRVAEEKEMIELRTLFDQCIARGALLGPGIAADGYQQQASDKLPSLVPESSSSELTSTSGASSSLSWPCYFLYPQYRQSDFIEGFDEEDYLADHMAVVFPVEQGPAPWDEQFEYKCNEMEVYLQLNAMPCFKNANEWTDWVKLKKAARGEGGPNMPSSAIASKTLKDFELKTKTYDDNQQWLRLNPGISMNQILRCKDHVVSGGVVHLFFYPKQSEAHQLFKKTHEGRFKELDLNKGLRPMPKC